MTKNKKQLQKIYERETSVCMRFSNVKKKTKQKKHKVCLMNFPILDKCKSIVDVLNYQKCELFIVNIP